MEAIKAGDGDLAEQLAHQHMINAYDNMVQNLAPLGVMVAHFTATPCFRVALAESTVTWSSVAFLFSSPRS